MNPAKMGLLSGGEASASGWGQTQPSSSSGWGSSSATQSNNSGWSSQSPPNHWGTGSSRQQSNGDFEPVPSVSPKPPLTSSWAQAVINSGPNQNQVPGSHSNNGCINSGSHCDNNSKEEKGKPADKKPEVIEAATLSDNWGNAVINQDNAWDLPPSPQSSPKESNSVWRGNSTTGTEIWENTVRHKAKGGGHPSATAPSNQPHVHTPSTHIGGTWGEEEDASMVWTGVPQTNGGYGSSHSNASSGSNSRWEGPVRHQAKESGPSANAPPTQSWVHTPSAPVVGTRSEEEDPSSVWTGVPQTNGGYGSSHSNASSGSNPNNSWSSSNNREADCGSDNNVAWKQGSSRNEDSARSVPSNAQWSSNRQQNNSWGDPAETAKPAAADDGTAVWGGGSNSNDRRPDDRRPEERRQPVERRFDDRRVDDRRQDDHRFDDRRLDDRRVDDRRQEDHRFDDRRQLEDRRQQLQQQPPPPPPPQQSKPAVDASAYGNWSPSKKEGWDEARANGEKRPEIFDDGTAVWGNPQRQQKSVSRWKEENAKSPVCANGNNAPSQSGANPMSSNSMQSTLPPASPGMIRLPPGAPISLKSNEVWNKSQTPQTNRLTSWPDGMAPQRDTSANPSSWGQSEIMSGENAKSVPGTPSTPNSGGWGDAATSPQSYWGNKSRNSNSWSDGQIDTSSWGGPKQKPLTKEMIWASKQFRMLTEMGYKRDTVENVLRSSNMNFEEAINELRAYATKENSMDMDGKSSVSGLNSNTPSLLTSSGIANSSLSSISSRSPSQMSQIHHQAQSQQQQSSTYPSVNQVQSALQRSQPRVGSTQNNPPSEKQLLHLVQQIQLAVQTGHLNAQILNQPLAPPTIQYIYQLLQQIKLLQQLQVQIASSYASKPSGPGVGPPVTAFQSQLHVQITQTKQRISNLQNQINVQQALFLKQQQQQQFNQHQGSTPSSSASVNHAAMHSASHNAFEFLNKGSGSDNNLQLPAEYRDLSLKDFNQQSQSRLKTTWKLPSFDKDDSNEFSRAPGSSANKQQPGSLSILTRDVSWSGLGDESANNWLDIVNLTQSNDLIKDNLVNSSGPTNPYNINDLVPEFEPGKPWKGSSQFKNVEDDPHITPGSVNRSPLSVNSIFNNWPAKVSPTSATTNESVPSTLTLSSSTWAFSPASSSLYTEPKGSKGYNSWGENTSPSDSLWSSGSKPRGPPPGLAQVKGSVGGNNTNSANLWNSEPW